MHLTFRHRDRHLTVELHRAGEGRFQVTVDGQAHDVEAALLDPSTLYLVIAGRARTTRIARVGQTYHVGLDSEVYVLTSEAGAAPSGGPGTLASPHIIAPMPGKVLQILVREDQEVAAGDGLLILEAMKMENRIVAEAPAIVRKVHVSEGQMVDGGAVLLELEYRASES